MATTEEPFYTLSAEGRYQGRNAPPGPGLDEVAICFEEIDDLIVRHKHGRPEFVRAWAAKNESAMNAESPGICQLQVVQGKPPLDLLNEMAAGNEKALRQIVHLLRPTDRVVIDGVEVLIDQQPRQRG